MHVKRLKRGPQVGDLIIMNGQTQKKYVVTGSGVWRREGRFGSVQTQDFVTLRYLGMFYADGRRKEPGERGTPYREIGVEWFYGGRHYGLNQGYSVVVQTAPGERWLTEQWKKKQSMLKRLQVGL